MPPKVAFTNLVSESHYNVIKGNIKKAKTSITAQLSILNKEMLKLGKTPAPTLFKKRPCLAALDHSQVETGRFLNTLQDLTSSANGLLKEILPNSIMEKDIILASLRELEVGKDKYSNLIDEFNALNSKTIEETSEEVNRGRRQASPTPSRSPGIEYVKHDELMLEVHDYSTSSV